MRRTLPILLSLLSLHAVAQEEPTSPFGPLADHLPAETVLHFEMPGIADLPRLLEGTELAALLEEEELQRFFAPSIDGFWSDLDYLLREKPEFAELARTESLGRVSFSLLSVNADLLDDDPTNDDFPGNFIVTLEARGCGDELFAAIRAAIEEAEKGGPHPSEFRTIGGCEAVSPYHVEGNPFISLLHRGDLLILAVGEEGLAEQFLGEPSAPLSSDERYTTVLEEVQADADALFVYLDVEAILDFVAEIETDDAPDADNPMGNLMQAEREILLGTPTLQALKQIGFSLRTDGAALHDRLFLHMPDDRSALGATGPLGDAMTRHAAIVPAGADLAFTVYFDLLDTIKNTTSEDERTRAVYEKYELTEMLGNESFSLSQVLETVREKTGVNIEEQLAPALGHALSFHATLPETSMLSLPEMGIVLDVSDREALDAALAAFAAAAEDLDEISVQTSEHASFTIYSASFPYANLPLQPAVARAGDLLLATASPFSLKRQLDNLEIGEHLADDERFAFDSRAFQDEHVQAAWFDLGSIFRYVYGFAGVALSATRMSGLDFGDLRFDPSLLPDGDLIAEYLGTGIITVGEKESGLPMDGRSTLGNPITGVLGGMMAAAGVVGISEGSREGVTFEKQKVSSENMRQLALALDAYRSSVGSGAYPTDLTQLYDRGLLFETDLLIDPADPKPKKVKTGSGERIKVSYKVVRVASQSERVRDRLSGKAEWALMTRGQWHSSHEGDCFLYLPLGIDSKKVHSFNPDYEGFHLGGRIR